MTAPTPKDEISIEDHVYTIDYVNPANPLTASKREVVNAGVARQLERELAAARKDVERYRWRLREIVPLFEQAREIAAAIRARSGEGRNGG